ncbi:hypothetical protein IE53DRAFT_330530 [Violaceomyces palustris]|uniref:Uncharacterized protein n=1 Tax=Violaceomyces palustris TaxID=1673888 RepID=A0ACD0NWU2_9BASI|nr:hypothetical protein IE53DRAFT_330530 [Violaceomyces palustris]
MGAGSFDLSLGCMFIGVVINVWLFGFSIVQAYIYYVNFKTDKRSMRIFVGFLMVADFTNTLLNVIFIYQYLVSNFGDLQYASVGNSAFAADPVMTGIIAFSTQMFFAWRVKKLMHSNLMPIIIVIGSLVSLLGAIGSTVGVTIVLVFSEFQKFQVIVIIWLVGAAVTDVLITGSLVFTLNKSRTGFAATDDIITKLIRLTLQTGMLTSAFAIIDIVLFLASTTTLHLVFNLPLAKLYVNSLLSTLNARVVLTGGNHHYTMEGTNSDASNLRPSNGGAGRAKKASSFRPNKDTATFDRPVMFKKHSASTGGGDADLVPHPFASTENCLEAGIHIRTVEETFEERHEDVHAPGYAPSSNGEAYDISNSNSISEKRRSPDRESF